VNVAWNAISLFILLFIVFRFKEIRDFLDALLTWRPKNEIKTFHHIFERNVVCIGCVSYLVVMCQGGIASVTLLLGMTSTIFGALFYVVFIDSKKEWPELRWYDRLLKVMTFQR